jgi:hypothetical protein
MLPAHLALTTNGATISASDLTKVAAALSKQILKDFGPIWEVSATIDSFLTLEDVPIDYWPIIVQRDVEGVDGYHEDEHGQPFALVEFSPDWPLTASHECLEMLADPFGRRLRAGNVPDQAIAAGVKPGKVQFLLEVCDPSESAAFAYQINGVAVSDFYTPHYFDPVRAPDVRYSFTGAITAPRQVLDGGYLTWRDPIAKHWMQLRMFPDQFSKKTPHVIDLSTKTAFEEVAKQTSLRAAIDRVTRPSPRKGTKQASVGDAQAAAKRANASQAARAEALRARISGLRRS